MAKTYTVTVNGSSNGNTITAPFEIKVVQLTHNDEEVGNESTTVSACTVNAAGKMCVNDDLADQGFDSNGAYKIYARQASNITEEAQLANTIEADLDAAYGAGNWS